MKNFKLIIWMVLVLALIIPTTVSADTGSGDQIIVGESFTVEAGDTHDGSFYVLGGTLTIEEDAKVNGDITLLGGSTTIAGEVVGDIMIFGGRVDLLETAVVEGDITSVGGSLTQDPAAKVSGNLDLDKLPEIQSTLSAQATEVLGGAGNMVETAVSEVTQMAEETPEIDTTPEPKPTKVVEPTDVPQTTPRSEILKPVFNFFKGIVSIFVDSIFLGVLAMLVALFIPNPLRRVTDAINTYPLLSEGVGVLTMVAAPIILVLITLTLILIPVTVVAIILLVAAVIMGWIAVGTELGIRMSKALKSTWHIAVSAGIGTLLLTLVMNTIWFIPCLGWLAVFLVAMVGLGAVLLTRYGFRIYSNLPTSDQDATNQDSVS